MGSKIVAAIVEQKGRITTRAGGSKPIEQLTAVPSVSSQTIEQRDEPASSSKPIEQREAPEFSRPGYGPTTEIIEQVNISRIGIEGSPIEQLEFSRLNTSQLEQRTLTRDVTSAQPIEQRDPISTDIDITQFDFSDSIFPPCNSVKNPVTTNILWRIKDAGFTFDVETLIFEVDGVEVQDYPSFSITPLVFDPPSAGTGLQLDYNPPSNFDFNYLVTIRLFISDNADPPNDFLYTCKWETAFDSSPPVVNLISPECNSTGVAAKEPVVLDIIDLGEGIDESSIRLSIEGIPVCSGITFDPITTVSGNGFRLTWDHNDAPFRYNSNVSVAVEATDLSILENSTLFVCCFSTGSSTVPEFINFDPEPCESYVDNTTGLYFEIYGDVDGVDISTLEVRVDNALRKVVVRPRILRSE